MKLHLVAALVLALGTAEAQTVRPYAPELFPENLSGAVCGFSADGSTIYFVREQPQTQLLWIYEAKRNGDRWTNENILPFSGVYSDLGGRFSPDGKVFYFTSNRPGGSINPDDSWNIWQVNKTGTGWADPIPLKEINNKGLECCPVPLSNGKLLFSGTRNKSEWQMLIAEGSVESIAGEATVAAAWQWPSYEDATTGLLLFNSMKRPDTKGMDDIYVSKFENGNWGVAKNLGEPINTKAYEDGAILTPDRKLIIFCRHDTHETPSRVMCVEWTEEK
jgi:hypothetical protein